ncbi:type VI secretion system needle sheath protein TssB [Desulfuromonas soudanensis]|uniref:Type VI secretion system needle sheath protein TssB n=1 Tax=Desulfuromonas soudanensis TaxID=1603606 RepID=A0A0M4D591_9BACT|nr:type VI secretion system contractile sheath small subunit [Desulfuromonas soudanensis]ALC17976.1 type VI secretion system needle sheath protein TssB [Desulfuromonas soudanensis]
MTDSFQKEIPKARINLSLDVETGGAKRKTELPLKLLVMGDFSSGKGSGRLAERERISLNRNNLEAVLKDLAPTAEFSVPSIARGEGEIGIHLRFDSLNSFHPEQVANQVPELHSLMAMRNLLKDLKSNVLDNGKFRRELENIVKNRPELEGLQKELEKIVSEASAANGE